ncbi:ZYRO0G06116p [Zygosaccharomyces rouxii]|uniref:ZYRO0G06116p n=1 Tax=Zygosaccharomyces rouxii (strain ATCC 2623 / CBS 732 / NBRC 1130 / NCYC 568 / NRRL Y-229) TaxID=559307 RepID=C5DZP4_ZYGRC|nr:uncharacterized protein ZYRO0G06116g [Zygosaccharomyces rouxii]KAH9202326.1 hypothetical protein LQ764DRAFT_5534 [Zygosaccharomyces rouxii]CAR29328.1 ZYRO0G06116p [Zygosaccharomyces rouxii]
MRFSTALTSALALLPFGATALQNKNGPFVLELEKDSISDLKNNFLTQVDADVFNGLARPLKGVFDGVGDILVSVIGLLGEVVGTVFYLSGDGVLFTQGSDPSNGVPGFSLNDQDQLLYEGRQLLGGFEGLNFKLSKDSDAAKRDLIDDINLNLFLPVSINAFDTNPSAPSLL